MRKTLLLCGLLVLIPHQAHATWSIVQAVFKNNCGAVTSCTLGPGDGLAALGAGHLILVIGHNTTSQDFTSVTATGETFKTPPFLGGFGQCNATLGRLGFGCAYTSKSVGGATSVVANFSGTTSASNTAVGVYELATTVNCGSNPSIFLENNYRWGTNSAGMTFGGVDYSSVGVPQGTNDVIFQFVGIDSGTISAIDTSFVLDNHTGQIADAHKLNTFDGTQPTWTNSASAASTISAIAFGENFCAPLTAFPNTASGLQMSYSGPSPYFDANNTQTLTITNPGQFELVFEADTGWGPSQWYDLVNDPSATTNLFGPCYASGPGQDPILAKNCSLLNRTYYGYGNDASFFGRFQTSLWPQAPRSLNVLEYSPSRIVIETNTEVPSLASPPRSNIVGTYRYYIYPNGQIYVHHTTTVTNAATIAGGASHIFTVFNVENPIPADPPDTQGWIRATSAENPWSGNLTPSPIPTYVFGYWSPNTPSPNTNYTKASFLLVVSPNNLHDKSLVNHWWQSGTGHGVTRWGWNTDPDIITLGNGGTTTEDMLIQLGTQGSTVLPNITSSAVAGPIANAYIANPNPPAPTTISTAVNQGTTVQWTANDLGTYALSGTDSSGTSNSGVGSITSGGLYTAPASVTAKHTSGGFQLLPNNHVFNTRIDSLPVNSNNAAWIAAANNGGSPNWVVDFPMNYNPANTDNMVFQYSTANNGTFSIPSFPSAIVEHGWFNARTNQNSDHHVIMGNTQTGLFSELYQYYAVGLNGACMTCNSQSGIQYLNSSYALPPISTDAAGMELQPLTLGLQELEQAVASGGTINHAMRNTFGTSGVVVATNIWPATQANTNPFVMPFGARWRLKSSFNISSYSAIAQVLLTQLKQYGSIFADGGNNWPMNAEYTRWPKAYYDALNEVAGIGATLANNIEFVDESGLQSGCTPCTATSGLTKLNREIVTFTRTSDSATIVSDVALQGVAVNLPNNYLYIQAGTPTQQLTAFVNIGSVTWSMSPAISNVTLSPSGALTVATGVAAVASTTVTATSIVNASVAAQMTVTVFPAGPIRVIPSKTTNYTDTAGNVWIARTGVNAVDNQGCCACDNSASFAAITDVALWNCQVGGSSVVANDVRMEFLVPNGPYQVTWRYGTVNAAGHTDDISINGNLVLNNADFATIAGGQFKPASDVTQNVIVTNNQLSVVIYGVNNSEGPVSSLSLIPGAVASGAIGHLP